MKAQHPAHPYSVYRRRRSQAEIWEAGLLRQGRNFVRMMCTSGAIVPPWLFEILERVGKRLGVWPYPEKTEAEYDESDLFRPYDLGKKVTSD